MPVSTAKKLLYALAAFIALWAGVKFVLPVVLPFLLGALIALASEPAVRLGVGQLKLPRWLASGLGVCATLVLLITVLWLAGALAVRELTELASRAPDLQQTARQGMTLLQDFLINIAQRTPDGVRLLLERTVLDFFGSGNALLTQVTARLPRVFGNVLSWLPDGALGLGTGLLAGFMISARLPRIKAFLGEKLPKRWYETYLPALRRLRYAIGGWLKAQLKLMGLTYVIVTVGLLVLGVPYAPVWAVAVALVDAVPMLGTGTVLLPWALVALLQGNALRALGLAGVYAVAMICRTVLEPRLVGKQLGLDPLVTLLFFYVGYRFWGFAGMLLAPILAAAVKSLTDAVA